MDIEEHILSNDYVISEGGCFKEQKVFFHALLLANPSIKNVMEIGFNAGFAMDTILAVRDDINATSFDIVHWDYVDCAKEYIDIKYPGRHVLCAGNSIATVPRFETEIKFDLIFIDGGHSHPLPGMDLANSRRLADAETLVVMDDYCESYGLDVIETWDEAVKSGFVRQLGEPQYFGDRGWVTGKYFGVR